MKRAELRLPYFKQGDDLSQFLGGCNGNVPEALERHASCLDAAARTLRQLKSESAGHALSILADTHVIEVTSPDDLIDRLVALKLLDVIEWDDEENWDDAEHEGFSAVGSIPDVGSADAAAC